MMEVTVERSANVYENKVSKKAWSMHVPQLQACLMFLNLIFPWVSAGFFTQISTLADVQENVMEYLHVLSRPKVIDQEHDVVWTEAYIDSTVSSGVPGKEAEGSS